MQVKFDSDMRVFAQIGDPLEHSCTSYIHNSMYALGNVNAINFNVVVRRGELPQFVEAAKVMKLSGFGITMPHKTDIIPLLDECDEFSRIFNSVNHVKIENGRLIGKGMDGLGMRMDFIARCGDELFNQMAKWQGMSAGLLRMPIVMRVTVGRQYGAQHSQDWGALCAHVPGLKVIYPATPYDAKGLLASAMNGTDPVVFMEGQILYDRGEEFHEGGVPAECYELPIGEPDVKIKGEDITIVTIGASLYSAREAAKELKEKYGRSAEVIDIRTLVPLNYAPIIDSVKRTGRVVVVGDEVARNSFMNNIAQTISELAFDYLDAPPCVVGAKNWICPAPEYDRFFYPSAEWILDAIHTRIMPLSGYVCKNNLSDAETLRKNKQGV